MESRKSCELDLKILKTTNQFSLWMYNGVLHTRSILKYSRAAGFLTRSKPTKSPGSTRRRNKPLNPPQSSVLMSLCNYLVINTSFWKKKTKNIHQNSFKKNTCCVSHPEPAFPNRSKRLQPGRFCSIVLEEIGTRWWGNPCSQIAAVMCTVKQKDGEFASRGGLRCQISCWAPTKL